MFNNCTVSSDVQLNKVIKAISRTLTETMLLWLPVLCVVAPPGSELNQLNSEQTNCIIGVKLTHFQDLPNSLSRKNLLVGFFLN